MSGYQPMDLKRRPVNYECIALLTELRQLMTRMRKNRFIILKGMSVITF